ncbi:hypothetical protein AQUCO_00700698v1 [Aquilegia coerulea]|uniref:PUL domain-containing protein n=1 Tax=Aquilegia coerulea TaxID=218851 RepID=A0A2G5EL78_AQUCA|nr:hypothetical protein AQUCO_00700698v1 [Aquilegia coerulea]
MQTDDRRRTRSAFLCSDVGRYDLDRGVIDYDERATLCEGPPPMWITPFPHSSANAYIPGESSRASGDQSKPVFKHIPKKGMLFFDSVPCDGTLEKIAEFNITLQSDPKQKDLSLTKIELSRLESIVEISKDTSNYECSTFCDVDFALLLKLLISWPVSMVFPVIDVLRMVILHPNGASLVFKHLKDGKDIVMETISKVTIDPAQAPHQLAIIHFLTSLFKHSCFHTWLQMHTTEVSRPVFRKCFAPCLHFVFMGVWDIFKYYYIESAFWNIAGFN